MVKFNNSAPKVFTATSIDVLCLNYAKFGQLEIGEIVRCLPVRSFVRFFCGQGSSLL